MQAVFLLGRLLMGGYFLIMGSMHMMNRNMLAGYAASKGVPMPLQAVLGTGLLLLFGGFGILTGFYVQWALLALVLFLVPVSFKMHAFWQEPDQTKRMPDQVNFMKNMALLGAILIFMAMMNPF